MAAVQSSFNRNDGKKLSSKVKHTGFLISGKINNFNYF